jgi:hypothetical protein
MMKEIDTMRKVDAIVASDLPDLSKLAQAFDLITQRLVDQARPEIELARAMNDQETVVKQQVKMETMKHAREIFLDCHLRVTGRRPWNEQE